MGTTIIQPCGVISRPRSVNNERKRNWDAVDHLGRQQYDANGMRIEYDENGNIINYHTTHFYDSPETDDGRSTFAPSTYDLSPLPTPSATPSPYSTHESQPELISIIPTRHNDRLKPPGLPRHSNGPSPPMSNHRVPQLLPLSPAHLQQYQPPPPQIHIVNLDTTPCYPTPAAPILTDYIYPQPLPQICYQTSFLPSSVYNENLTQSLVDDQQAENRPFTSHNASRVHHSQIELQSLPASSQPQLLHQHHYQQIPQQQQQQFQQVQLGQQQPLRPTPQPVSLQRSYSDLLQRSNWSSDLNFMPPQPNSVSSEGSVGLFPPPVVSQPPSLNGDAEENEVEAFVPLSARTLALMDQPESEVTMYDCEYCEKTYQGKHARSIWRRHLSDKHKIPLATQPRRTRWDNDANRPKTEEERRERTLESKRRWARKNRAAKKAARDSQKLGLTGCAPVNSAENGEVKSRATSPSHSASVSPSSQRNKLARASSLTNHTLSVPPNIGRSQSLQVSGPRDSTSMARVLSAPHSLGPYPSPTPSVNSQSSYNHLASLPQFLPPEWSFQFNAPIMTSPFNLHSFPQLHLTPPVKGSERVVGENVASHQLDVQQAHHLEPNTRHGQNHIPHPSNFQLNQMPYQPHQQIHPMPLVNSKDPNMPVYSAQLAYSAFGSPSVSWSPSMKFDVSFTGSCAPQMIQPQDHKRPRFDQAVSLPLAAEISSVTRRAPSATHSVVELKTLSLKTQEQDASLEGEVQSSQSSEDGKVQVDDSQQSQHEEEEEEEEEDAPICSAASSTRCSTSAGLGGDAPPAAPTFDFSKLEHQQTPARPSGLRDMARSGYPSPMNGAVGRFDEAGDVTRGMDLFSSPMIGPSDGDSSFYQGAFAPMSAGKPGKEHQTAVLSSGGSIGHWSIALQTPSDPPRHHGRSESFGSGHIMMSPPMHGGLFGSPQHNCLSKGFALASSGAGRMDEAITGFLESSWQSNQ